MNINEQKMAVPIKLPHHRDDCILCLAVIQLRLSFSFLNNQNSSFLRLIDVEDDVDAETQDLCNQETRGSVSPVFNPVLSGCSYGGMVSILVWVRTHAYDLHDTLHL